MADDDGYASEGSSPRTYDTSPYAKNLPGTNLSDLSCLGLDGFFDKSMRMGAAKASARHPGLRRAVSEELIADEQLEITDSLGRNLLTRTITGESWWLESQLPVARQLRRRSKCETFARAPSSAVLFPEWPAVDQDLVASCKRQLLSFELDPTTLPTDVLCHLAMEMFVSVGLPAGLAEDRVRRFILAVRAAMLDNPYHNFYHVFDVMQTANALATATGTMARLNAWERFALLSAALCHDLEHPGVTSAFLSKAGDSAHDHKHLTFRDALLEKHHALRALGVMVDSHVGLLEGLSTEEYYQFRSTVSKIILATDITRHTEYLARLQEFAARRAEDPAAEMDKQLAMEIMVKCADISNVIKPMDVARRWALRVTDEFFHQGDAERSMGMEVSPICDRLASSRVALQTGFIDFLAGPLFTQLGALFPAAFQAPLAQLAANRASYALCTDVELEQSRPAPPAPVEVHVTEDREELVDRQVPGGGACSGGKGGGVGVCGQECELVDALG